MTGEIQGNGCTAHGRYKNHCILVITVKKCGKPERERERVTAATAGDNYDNFHSIYDYNVCASYSSSIGFSRENPGIKDDRMDSLLLSSQ